MRATLTPWARHVEGGRARDRRVRRQRQRGPRRRGPDRSWPPPPARPCSTCTATRTTTAPSSPWPAPPTTSPAAARALAAATVARLDLSRHAGAHPRLGVLDVVPFVPYEPGGPAPDDLTGAAAAARRLRPLAGRRVGRAELSLRTPSRRPGPDAARHPPPRLRRAGAAPTPRLRARPRPTPGPGRPRSGPAGCWWPTTCGSPRPRWPGGWPRWCAGPRCGRSGWPSGTGPRCRAT